MKARQRPDGQWEVIGRNGDLICGVFESEDAANAWIRNNPHADDDQGGGEQRQR